MAEHIVQRIEYFGGKHGIVSQFQVIHNFWQKVMGNTICQYSYIFDQETQELMCHCKGYAFHSLRQKKL